MVPLNRKIATSIHTDNALTCVKYHATDVVNFNSQIIILDTGGWKTATTKKRMNQASKHFELGFNVYAKDFKWRIKYKDSDLEFTGNKILLNR